MTGDLSDLVIENKGQLKAVRNILTSKSGRPRKPDSEKMSKKITVNFTQKEYEALQEKSETMPIAVFIRTVLKRNDCI